MAGFHDITTAIVGAGFIGPVHVEGLRRLGIRVKGIAELARLREKVAFQCTLDAQSTMPLGSREDIEREAREVVAGLSTPRGGLIASIYWDPASLGVDDERQLLGVRSFLEACDAARP